MDQHAPAVSAPTRTPLEPRCHRLKDDLGEAASLAEKLLRAFSGTARTKPRAFFHFSPTDLAPHIQEHSFPDTENDVPVYCYVSRAPVERGVVVACTGKKEFISLSNQRIEALHAQGLSYICLELPNVGEDRHMMPLYERYERFFFLHPNSPVHTLFPASLKKFIEAHSTGGQGVLKMATHPDTSDQIASMYCQLHADAPFLDSPKASLRDPWYRRHAFTIYAKISGDQLPERTWIGNFYMVLEDFRTGKIVIPENAVNLLSAAVKETHNKMRILRECGNPWAEDAMGMEGRFRLPTYAQIIEIRDRGREHIRYIEKNGIPERHIPMTLYADPRDQFSSYVMDRHFCDLTGATLIDSNGLHNPFNADDAVFARFSETMEAELPPWPAPDIVPDILTEQLPPPAAEKTGWLALPPLQAVISFSREGPARLLNSATSLLQRTFGRGVGNAEMRRETESSPVHTSHALRLK
jgi:hypothetical protein